MINVAYERNINSLIPMALMNTERIIIERYGRKGKKRKIKGKTKKERFSAMKHAPGYDRIFHHEMNRLAREAGLRDI